MAILTTTEISDRLAKSATGYDPLKDNGLVGLDWPGVEAMVKRRCRRNFESASYTSYFNISEPGISRVILEDWPVSAFTSLSYLTAVSSAGVETWQAYDAGDYVVDLNEGIVRLRYDEFSEGVRQVKAVYTAGYTSAQLTANALDEVLILKSLLLSIIQREYAINKEHKRHMRSHSFGDESTTYNFDFTFDELSKIRQLKRWEV